MALLRAAHVWAAVGAIALLFGVVQGDPSIPVRYCAVVNTADMDAINSNFQSQGRCFNNCTSLNFPLAVVQEKNCWCANLVPARQDQKPLTSCQEPCPGYPSDYCGGIGTFGYMQLANPLGTASPGTTNAKSSSSVNDDVSPTATPSVQTVTVGGVVKTVTATPSATGETSPATMSTSNGGLAGGAIAGIVIGVLLLGAAMAALFFFMCYRNKRRKDTEGLFTSSRRGSSPGMLETPKTGDLSEAPRFGVGVTHAATWDMNQSSKRRSNLMPVDPRLDPFAKGIYAGPQNKSHESINSLQDNHDYSRRIQEAPRVLRAMNPDPDD
ncbi:hypothetical protein QBC47DRAFT_389826 [Echria macrotheca]|uniref:WSC domain-containing protein n=1 Tax=Echria macrotheca TaxID=438768 RepID=A0AAJ0B8J5_9PEZI|nr:hypothetical protein QBC47DRAFT_389826 [Echria macrotheca]